MFLLVDPLDGPRLLFPRRLGETWAFEGFNSPLPPTWTSMFRPPDVVAGSPRTGVWIPRRCLPSLLRTGA
jgi:hypothetical protein